MKTRQRLDALLVDRGLFESRTQAKAAIMSGIVFVDGQCVDKAGALVSSQAQIDVQAPALPYVSRGGLKLEHALDRFSLSVQGRTCLDVGASTGGFTDCLLQRGAALVYAVDVGYGQLAWKLRQDLRVRVYERTNFRHAAPGTFSQVNLVTIDVSFISLLKILPALEGNVVSGVDVIALIKPQFEAGRQAVDKGGGVIRDPSVHRTVLERVLQGATDLGWIAWGLTRSPITGPRGNAEFLVWWRLKADGIPPSGTAGEDFIDSVVSESHKESP